MKAILIEKTGGPEVLQYREVADPEPGDREVLVQNQAVGVNFIDIYHRTGLYPQNMPFIPGSEGSGIIVKTGKDVHQLKEGDHVAYCGVQGAYAERVVATEDKLVQLTSRIDHDMAAAVMLQGLTAHYLSHSVYPLKAGDVCLVHAAAGGVGLLLTQMAKIAGAKVIGTVSTEEKAKLAREAGADEIIRYTIQDFEEEVGRITGGKGVDVVYDSVGKDTFMKSLNCLKPRGMMALFGQSSGKVLPFDPGILNQKGSLFLTRPSLGYYTADKRELKERADDVFCWIIENKLNVRIDRSFHLSEASKAHEALEGRQTMGKVILNL